jgi:hypothetical protein
MKISKFFQFLVSVVVMVLFENFVVAPQDTNSFGLIYIFGSMIYGLLVLNAIDHKRKSTEFTLETYFYALGVLCFLFLLNLYWNATFAPMLRWAN